MSTSMLVVHGIGIVASFAGALQGIRDWEEGNREGYVQFIIYVVCAFALILSIALDHNMPRS